MAEKDAVVDIEEAEVIEVDFITKMRNEIKSKSEQKEYDFITLELGEKEFTSHLKQNDGEFLSLATSVDEKNRQIQNKKMPDSYRERKSVELIGLLKNVLDLVFDNDTQKEIFNYYRELYGEYTLEDSVVIAFAILASPEKK